MIVNECPNALVIKLLMYAMMFSILLVMFFIVMMKKTIVDDYKDILVQFNILKRDLELNTMLKHEHIQSLLCPHDLLDFNNKHIFKLDKCKNCNKNCKRECWIQYFIDKNKSKSRKV